MKGALAYVALGANLGDRLATLREAVRRIDGSHGLTVLRCSAVWETAAVGPPQPDYLNAVIEVDACKAPWAHLQRLHEIERSLGRVRRAEERWGPRTLDLDLLWQGGLILQQGDLELPHPRITERSFVLAPLAELAPSLPLGERAVAAWLEARPAGERASVRRVGPLAV
ncbi:2-amino-4-hydroxy-6-hydroxymethyldihydropteridine diphosphokinase [Vulgatibacter sp.]|uniref:2-amino-4-hydroxy-6- hydroxymethyldihydropteridine diphosphokinase n=1 Tax=Vulgatibacter sp. TaxID=1971226 RepID=UPI0035632D96